MKGISEFLERFKNFIPPNRALTRAVQAALMEVLGIGFSEKEITVVRGAAKINAPGAVKSEIRLHKQEIIFHVHAKTGAVLRDLQ